MRHTWLAATLIGLLPAMGMAQSFRGGGGFRGGYRDGGRHYESFDHGHSHSFFGLSLGFNVFDYPTYAPRYYDPVYYSPAPVVVYQQPTYYSAPPTVIYAPAPVIVNSGPACTSYYSTPTSSYYGGAQFYYRR